MWWMKMDCLPKQYGGVFPFDFNVLFEISTYLYPPQRRYVCMYVGGRYGFSTR